jgi:CRISPR-associated endonuclease/helicase Cas3
MKKAEGYFKYWGKARKREDGGWDYHLLPYHCLDVAAVGGMLVERMFVARHVAVGLRCEPREIVNAVTFLCAIHDIGKFSEGFQNLRPELLENLNGVKSRVTYQEKHWSIGYRFFCENTHLISSVHQDIVLDVLSSWLAASAGHHGRPPKNEMNVYPVMERFSQRGFSDASEFIKDTQVVFNAKQIVDFLTEKQENVVRQFSWVLAGLIVLSDWIGSNQKWFPFCSKNMRLQDYWEQKVSFTKTLVNLIFIGIWFCV